MLTPFPTQIEGARWLSSQRNALLADEPRVGKTGTAIMALDDNFDDNVLIVTTASGRPVWRRALRDWTSFERNVRVVGWPELNNPKVLADLLRQKWDRLVLDESHFAKSYDAKRTQAVFGIPHGREIVLSTALFTRAKGVWCLSGTPIPNAPNDLFPMMRALCPERLEADPRAERQWPDVMKYDDFLYRYCVVRMKKLSNFRKIPVVMGGKNLDELRARLDGFWLRRTQADVGIREPVYETLPLAVSDRMRKEADGDVYRAAVLEAAEAGDTRALEMHLGPLRRITGTLKAHAVITAVKDEFDSGLDKVVLAYWHKDVGQALREGLSSYGVVGIDGSASAIDREAAEQRFLHDAKIRVFLGQIQAAGEAIDLSSASTMIFVETSLVPKDMAQMSKRITNHTQRRQPIVRVAVLEGSIDEALEEVLLRKWSAIREVLKGD
jgi:SWI/SNF-related matrix-associated actin-dependent regulator 1 of chromatin subfamily A